MAFNPSHAPEFGQADLSNCEREQIQFAGSIQPHGALAVLRESDLVILQASANLRGFLGLGHDPRGARLGELDADLAERIANLSTKALEEMPVPLRCRVGSRRQTLDALVHRLPEGALVLELEPAGAPVELTRFVESAFQTILASLTLTELCDDTARIFKDLTGYDRVMVYRFDEDGHGEVFSESREAHLEPYLGNRYPASDIPQIARRLYERNRIRELVDIDYVPVTLEPRFSPLTGRDIDMSLCTLRSVSPIHVQYLKNMGVSATLVVSLMVGGRLWGLISCHHYRPRKTPYETKAVCELLAETMATRIAALESFARAEAELSVRRLEKRVIEAIGREGDWKAALFGSGDSLLQAPRASGAALSFEGQVLTTGEVPATHQIRSIVEWLDRQAVEPLFATGAFGSEVAEFKALTPTASGLIAVRVSRSPGEYLLWFRPERVHTVTWGGNPFKPVEVGDDPRDLSPRRSFAQWQQVVEGTAEQWSTTDLAAAHMIGESIEDVVYQFRAVRMLIAQDQLAQVSRDVRIANQPVIVADAAGRVLLVNAVFEQLLPEGRALPQSLDELPLLFREPVRLRAMLRELLDDQRSWRGEVHIEPSEGVTRTLLLRADPVFAAADRTLGYVLFFADLTGRKAIETARRQFQQSIVETQHHHGTPLDNHADVLFRNLLSPVIGNAKLAAYEITDGMELEAVPEMLEAVKDSVARTARVLERLIDRLDGDEQP